MVAVRSKSQSFKLLICVPNKPTAKISYETYNCNVFVFYIFFFPEQRFFMWFVFVLLVKCCFHFYFVLEGAINLIYEQCGHFKFGRFTFQIEGEGGACMNFLIKTSKIINYCILVKKKRTMTPLSLHDSVFEYYRYNYKYIKYISKSKILISLSWKKKYF